MSYLETKLGKGIRYSRNHTRVVRRAYIVTVSGYPGGRVEKTLVFARTNGEARTRARLSMQRRGDYRSKLTYLATLRTPIPTVAGTFGRMGWARLSAMKDIDSI